MNILGCSRALEASEHFDRHHVGLCPGKAGPARLHGSLGITRPVEPLRGLKPEHKTVGWLHAGLLGRRPDLGQDVAVLLVHGLVVEVLHVLRAGDAHVRICPHVAHHKSPFFTKAHDEAGEPIERAHFHSKGNHVVLRGPHKLRVLVDHERAGVSRHEQVLRRPRALTRGKGVHAARHGQIIQLPVQLQRPVLAENEQAVLSYHDQVNLRRVQRL